MLRLTTMGVIDLRDRLGRPVREVLAQPKRIALLVHLAVEGRLGPVNRDRVLAMFWPESDEARARNALSQALYHLRQALGTEVIEGQGASLSVTPEALWCDALVMEEAIARGDAELALDLQRGEFCPGLVVTGAPAVEGWLSITRRDQRRRLLAMVRGAVARLERANDPAAARIARRALALPPDDEAEVRSYLQVLERAGEVAGALLAYADYERRLAMDLETEPSAETRQLVEVMRARRAADAQVGRSAVSSGATPAGTDLSLSDVPRIEVVASPPASVVQGAGMATAALPAVRTDRRALVALAALALVALLAAGALFVRAGKYAAAGPTATVRAVAVFPFTVRGDASIDFLSEGMPDLLAAKLDGAPELRVIDPRSSVAAAAGRTPDPAGGVALARTLDARYFVLGDVTESAGRLQVDGALYEVGRGAKLIATATVAGDSASLFRVVDDLAGRLLAGMLAGRDTSLTQLAAVTTSSLPALKAYLRGERDLRAGRDPQAAAAFLEATQLDSSFALAHYRLAVMATWVHVPGDGDPAIRAATAARHAGRLTALGRDLLEAYRAYKTLDPRTERMYRRITASHPDNVEAWFMLGEALFHYNSFMGRSASEARPAFERALALDPANGHALLHLARLAAYEGRTERLDSLTTRFLALQSEATRTLEMRALRAWVRDDSAVAAAITREAVPADGLLLESLVNSATVIVQDLDAAWALKGQFEEAARDAPINATWGRLTYGTLPLAGGRWGRSVDGRARSDADATWLLEAQALAAAEPVFGLSRARLTSLRDEVVARRRFIGISPPTGTVPSERGEVMREYLLALLDLRIGDTIGTRRHEEALRKLAGASRASEAGQLEIAMRAERARAARQPEAALAELDRFTFALQIDRLAHVGVRERFARAELLVSLGRDVDALPLYESFMTVYDLPFAAVSRLRQAQIHERAGRRERAGFCYRRFLALWRDADPEFRPMVDSARQALARLE